ncbi:acyltransferase [Kitasatospora sp. NBC_01250]|uniref:acyltransferase family protein n=1 Tax=Kitasatospora sp. NBC_01250 TaxID=2903571 RepID=UPI002E3557A9|nr:acyltransferase [Kitasatospora sp. NBC_01250]
MPIPLPLLNRRSGSQADPVAAPDASARVDGPQPAASAKPGKRPRLYALDGMRLIAALGVLFFHYTGKDLVPSIYGTGSPRKVLPRIHDFGVYSWLGVELFFLISGFVICMSCWGKRPKDFLTSRVVRLYPAYWFGVLATAAVVLIAARPWGSYNDITPQVILSNLTMMQWPIGSAAVDPVYWTLWVEMRFYVFFAIVVAFGLTYRRVVLFCMIWAFAAIFAPMVNFGLLTEAAQPVYAPFFIGGMVMYLMYRFKPNFLLWAMLAFSWLLAQNQMPTIMKDYESEANQKLSWTICVVVMTACYLAVLLAALGKLNWISWKWLATAGALTYPLYLLHQEIGWIALYSLHKWLSPLPLLLTVIAGLLVIAWLVHKLVEQPLSRALKKGMDSSFKAMLEAPEK